MKKKILAVASIFLVMTACTANKQIDTSPSAAPPHDTSENAPDQQLVIPSLTVSVNGKDVLLVDMNEALVRGFFSGCDGYNVSSLDIVVTSFENQQEIHGYIDPRYTYSLYRLDTSEDEDYYDIAQKLLEGENLADCIVPAAPQYEGILFDASGFPICIAQWDDVARGYYSPVTDEMNRYEAPDDQIDAFLRYFGGHILIMTDEIRNELKSHEFDLDKTTVKAGWFGYPGFFFSDGEHELIRVTGDIMNGYYTNGAYITPKELGKDAADFAVDEENRRKTVPSLAPGENPPTG